MSSRPSRKRAASPAKEASAAAAPAAPAGKRSKKASASSASSAAAAAAAAPAASTVQASVLAHAGLDRVPAGSRGVVLSFGSGDISQLGLGSEEKMRERKKPTLVPALADKNTVALAVGALHNLVIVAPGRAVHSWGCNDDQALGRGSDEWFPAPVDGPLGQGDSAALPGGVAQIAAGASHSIALSAGGDVYSWGTYRDASGVIGFSDTLEAATAPIKLTTGLPKGVKVVQIAAGEAHDAVLTEQGEVYQWGDIGIGRRFSDRMKRTKLVPQRVAFKRSPLDEKKTAPPKKVTAVFAGGHSTFALDEQGTAWFWGPNNYSQGGRPNPNKDDLTIRLPTPVPGLPPVVKVACAEHHSLFLTRDGAVYSVGRGEDGRLGHGDSKNYESPALIAALSNLPHGDRVVDLAAGECHSLVWTAQGRLFTFGYGDLLQLGQGAEQDEPSPVLLQSQQIDEGGEKKMGRKVVQAGGGSQHSVILTVERTQPAPWAAKPAAAAAAAAASS